MIATRRLNLRARRRRPSDTRVLIEILCGKNEGVYRGHFVDLSYLEAADRNSLESVMVG